MAVGSDADEHPAPLHDKASNRFTLGQLEADYDQLCAAIREEHPLFHADRGEFEAVVAQGRAALWEGMTELELLRVSSSVVRATNCGHGSLNLSQAAKEAFDQTTHFLPLSIGVADGRLVVLRSVGAVEVPRGADIERIDGRTTDEIVTLLCDRMPGDGANVTRKLFRLNEQFHEWYALLVSNAEEHAVVYREPHSGERVEVTLAGVSKAAWPEEREPTEDEPREIGTYSFSDDHAWLKVKSFVFYTEPEGRRFRAFVDEFFAELATRRVGALVLDLRGNGGGDPHCGAYLWSHLLERPAVYFAESGTYYSELKGEIVPAKNAFAGRLIVLIDGAVFSTGGHVASLLKYHRRAWFIGEETGGSFACTSNSHDIVLRNTGLRLSNARTVFRTAVEGLPPGRGVFPDERVIDGVDDLLAGRDTVRERALARVRDQME